MQCGLDGDGFAIALEGDRNKKSNDDIQSHALNSRNQRVVDVKYLKKQRLH